MAICVESLPPSPLESLDALIDKYHSKVRLKIREEVIYESVVRS